MTTNPLKPKAVYFTSSEGIWINIIPADGGGNFARLELDEGMLHRLIDEGSGILRRKHEERVKNGQPG